MKDLLEAQFSASGLEDDLYTKSIFVSAFERGFYSGNSTPPMKIKPFFVFKIEVECNVSLKEIICMQNRITEEQYFKFLNMFFNEQTALQTTYKEISEVNHHFRFWIKKNCDFFKATPNKTNKL